MDGPKCIPPLDPSPVLWDGRGASVEPCPRLLLLPPRLVGVLLQPLREPLPVQVQRGLERLDPVPVAVVALLKLVRQLKEWLYCRLRGCKMPRCGIAEPRGHF